MICMKVSTHNVFSFPPNYCYFTPAIFHTLLSTRLRLVCILVIISTSYKSVQLIKGTSCTDGMSFEYQL